MCEFPIVPFVVHFFQTRLVRCYLAKSPLRFPQWRSPGHELDVPVIARFARGCCKNQNIKGKPKQPELNES
jgi:hypothetical protein